MRPTDEIQRYGALAVVLAIAAWPYLWGLSFPPLTADAVIWITRAGADRSGAAFMSRLQA